MEKKEKNENIQALLDSQVEGLSKVTDKKFGIATCFTVQGMSLWHLLHFSCSSSPEVNKLFSLQTLSPELSMLLAQPAVNIDQNINVSSEMLASFKFKYFLFPCICME